MKATKTIQVTSISENMQLIEAVKTFPNTLKSNSHLYILIESTKSKTVQFELINLHGQSIMSGDFNLQLGSNSKNIHIGEIPAGVYFLKFSSGKYSQKVVVME